MIRYKNIGTVAISVGLNNGFEIVAIANYNKKFKDYKVSLYIKDATIDTLDLMEKFEKVIIKGNKNNVRNLITAYIEQQYNFGCFDYYIGRYKYLQACFDYGCDNMPENN